VCPRVELARTGDQHREEAGKESSTGGHGHRQQV
jgi:hypothetical protein